MTSDCKDIRADAKMNSPKEVFRIGSPSDNQKTMTIVTRKIEGNFTNYRTTLEYRDANGNRRAESLTGDDSKLVGVSPNIPQSPTVRIDNRSSGHIVVHVCLSY